MVEVQAAPPDGGGGGRRGHSSTSSVDVLRERLDNVIRNQNDSRQQLDRIEHDLRNNFIRRPEFDRLANSVVTKQGEYWMVKMIVFGVAGMILVATFGALLSMVFK